MVQKGLFGDAIVAELPNDLVDVSYVFGILWFRLFRNAVHRSLRQVPDNQEVFLYPDSNVSIVIEVLQRVSKPIDAEAVK